MLVALFNIVAWQSVQLSWFCAWKLLSILVIYDDTAPDPGSSTN